jgi:hypothetical protein
MTATDVSKSQSYQVESLGDLLKILKESGAGKALLENGALIAALMLGLALFFGVVFWVLWRVVKKAYALGKEHPEAAMTALLIMAVVGGKDRRKKTAFGRPKNWKI